MTKPTIEKFIGFFEKLYCKIFGHDFYWGKYGHYGACLNCGVEDNEKLK